MMMMNFAARVRQQKHGNGKLSFTTIIYSDKCSVHYLIFFFRVLPGKTKLITDFQIIISSTVVSAGWGS